MLDPKVFKAYDVRGHYPSELDEEGAHAIGRAFVEQFEPTSIAVGRDMRVSSPSIAAAVIEGATEGGSEVKDIGMIGTEMLYFAVGELGLDGGITVTASHNPKDYTGMKIVRRGALPVGGDSGLLEIRDRAAALSGQGPPGQRGQTRVAEKVDIYPAFVEKVSSFIDPSDGTFPNHEPNPLLPENREFIIGKVLEEKADLGIAFDGDADRCLFVDDTGEFVPGDFVTALLAESILEREPGAKIIYDVRASWAVRDTIERVGGIPLMNRVGHAFIKLRMREEGAVFAGEVSGHYYFRDFNQADSGAIPALLMLELISKRDRRLSELLRPYRERYFLTGELNMPVEDVALKLQELKEHFAGQGEISHLDGISVTAENWHMNVRPSNTEPLLRLNLEALDPELMKQKRDEVLSVIHS
jgi:phosphomannomutase